MEVRRINGGPERVYTVVFADGEDPIHGLEAFARAEGMAHGTLTAIGTLRRAVVGVCDGRRQGYDRIPVERAVDVVLLVGDIDDTAGRPELRLRTVLGTRGGQVVAGHLLEAEVRSILEVTVSQGAPKKKPRHVPQRAGGEWLCSRAGRLSAFG